MKIIYLIKEGLHVYSAEGIEDEINFPQNLLKDIEIIDLERLKKTISDHFTEVKTEGQEKAILVLGNDLIFKKNFIKEDPLINKKKIDQFFENIPLTDDFLGTKRIITTEIYLYATNQKLLSVLKEELEKVGLQIESAVPISIFGDLGKEEKLKNEEVAEILQNLESAHAGNFFIEDAPLEIEDQPQKEEAEKKKETLQIKHVNHLGKGVGEKDIFAQEIEKKVKPKFIINPVTIFLVFLLTLVIALGFLGALKFGFIDFPFVPKDDLKKQTVTSATNIATSSADTQESTTSSKLTPQDRQKITIQVLNGTGIKGQASKVKTLLEDLGYENIQTANADNTEAQETVIVFSTEISPSVREEILTKVKEIFLQITTTDNSKEDLEFDIIITTGEEK